MPTSTGLNLRTFRVLVVEDHKLLRQMLTELLEQRGATCLSFETADDALISVLGGYVPDLLITDHLVPGQISLPCSLQAMDTRSAPISPLP